MRERRKKNRGGSKVKEESEWEREGEMGEREKRN